MTGKGGKVDNARMNHEHPVVSFRCANRSEYESLERAAKAQGLTVAQWARGACMDILTQRGGAL